MVRPYSKDFKKNRYSLILSLKGKCENCGHSKIIKLNKKDHKPYYYILDRVEYLILNKFLLVVGEDYNNYYYSNTSYLELHHKVPLSDGGTNDKTNLVLLCKACHLEFHKKLRILNM